MTALPQDVVAELAARIAELEQRLQSGAIENTHLQHELAVSRERQKASAEILATIAGTSGSAEHALQQIAETTARLFGASSVSIQLVENGEWGKAYRYGTSAQRIRSAVPLTDIKVGGRNMPGAVIGRNQQIHVPDLDDLDPDLAEFPGLPHARAAGSRTMCGTPLRSKGKAIGSLIIHRDRLEPFTAEELALQQSFADQAVIAIENARLFNEVQAKTRDLTEALIYQTGSANILKVIASSPTNVEPALKAIVESACELCDAYDAAVVLQDGDDLRFSAHHGPIPIGLEKWPINRNWTAGRAFVDQTPVHVDDLSDERHADFPDGRELAIRMGHRSILSVPLLRERESIGAIVLRRKEVHPFTEKQIALLQTFADQAVIAISNVRLFEQLQTRTADLSESLQQQTATSEVLQVISSSPGELEPVFQTMLTNAMRLCEASHGVVWLREGDGFRSAALHGPWPDGFVEQWRSGTLVRPGPDAPITRAAVTGKAAQIADLGDSPAYRSGDPLPVAAVDVAGIRTVLSVPMFRDEECVGAIALSRREVRLFADKQIELVANFAKQAVIAIENARLLKEIRQRTDDLSESLEQQTATSDVLQVISNSSGDLQPVFDAMLANATRICEARFGMMWLIEGTAARCVALHNAPPAFAALREREPVIHPGPNTAMGRLLKTKQVVHVEDAMAEPAYIEGDPVRRANTDLAGARTIVAVPMLRDGEVIGAIGIFHQQVQPFTEKQIQLVNNFASQAVIAIENARLLNELRQRTTELSRSLDDLRAAQDRLVQTEKLASLGQLTAGIAHEIKNPLNFVNNFAALSAELTDELNELLGSAGLAENIRDEVEELSGLLKDNLQKVVQHGKRADSIVKNMLLHSRDGSGEHRPTDVNALVDESLNLAYHGVRAEQPQFNVTLKRELDPAAGMVEVFPQEITRVLLNLISNGFYAVAKRGSENASDFEPVLSASTRDHGGHVEICIRDNGTGIPPEVQEKMFNPFFTTKPAGEGTGLGLSMSHDIIVKQHGGTIDVETMPGEFTEFTIRLPRKSNFSDRTRG